MDIDIIKIIAYILVALVVGGGALFAINKRKLKRINSKQSNISITGDKNKIVGGDDSSHEGRK